MRGTQLSGITEIESTAIFFFFFWKLIKLNKIRICGFFTFSDLCYYSKINKQKTNLPPQNKDLNALHKSFHKETPLCKLAFLAIMFKEPLYAYNQLNHIFLKFLYKNTQDT